MRFNCCSHVDRQEVGSYLTEHTKPGAYCWTWKKFISYKCFVRHWILALHYISSHSLLDTCPFLRMFDISILTHRTNIFIRYCRKSSSKTAFKYDLVRRVLKIAKSDYWLRHECQSVRPSVRLSAWNNSAPTGRIFIRFDILAFFENLSRKLKFVKVGKEQRVLYIKIDTHFHLYLAEFLEIKIFQPKVVEELETHISFSATYFRESYRLWDKVEKYGRTGKATGQYGAFALHAG